MCDALGFSQHKFECASDTVQELFLFADHFRPITQPFLYNASRDVLMERVKKTQPPALHAIFIKYVLDMQERFQRHYDAIQYSARASLLKRPSKARKVEASTCSLLAAKKARSAALGPAMLRRLKEFAFDTGEYGVANNAVLWTMSRLILFFELPCEVSKTWNSQTTGVYIVMQTAGSKSKEQHVVGVLKCNDGFLWYDNTFGIVQIDMEVVKRLRNVCLWQDILGFHQNKRITHYWDKQLKKWKAYKGAQPRSFNEDVYTLFAFACLNWKQEDTGFPKPTEAWDISRRIADWQAQVYAKMAALPPRKSTRKAAPPPALKPKKRLTRRK